MQHFGKIFGVFLGLLSGIGWIGCIIGLIIGYIADKITFFDENNKNIFNDQKEKKNDFFKITFQVMGHLTKSKGRVTYEDIQIALIFMRNMNLNKKDCNLAKKSFYEGKKENYPLRQKLQKLKKIISSRHDLIKIFLEIQINAAFIDRKLHPNEKKILYIIAEELGISSNQFEQLFEIFKNDFSKQNSNFESYEQDQKNYSFTNSHNNKISNLEQAYNILGIKVKDDVYTIKRAYKKMMSKNHPDKLLAKGLSSKKINQAKEKTQIIQAAYNFIKKNKNIK